MSRATRPNCCVSCNVLDVRSVRGGIYRWINQLLWEWNAVARNCVILNFPAIVRNRGLMKLVAWSVQIALGEPKRQTKEFINASVRKSWIVKTCEFLLGVVGRDPTISIEFLSMSIKNIDWCVLIRFNFSNWQLERLFTYYSGRRL